MTTAKINQLQLLQQNLQSILAQKQQIQNQNAELESALSGLKNSEKAYKILGNIMISSSKEELVRELEDKKEIIELRLKNVVRQENKLNESIEKLQEEVMAELKQEKEAKKE